MLLVATKRRGRETLCRKRKEPRIPCFLTPGTHVTTFFYRATCDEFTIMSRDLHIISLSEYITLYSQVFVMFVQSAESGIRLLLIPPERVRHREDALSAS